MISDLLSPSLLIHHPSFGYDIDINQLSGLGMAVSTLGPLSSLYVVLPIVLGITILKEPVTPKKALGLILAVSAIYVLSSAEHESHHIEHHKVKEKDIEKEEEKD